MGPVAVLNLIHSLVTRRVLAELLLPKRSHLHRSQAFNCFGIRLEAMLMYSWWFKTELCHFQSLRLMVTIPKYYP